MKQLLLVLLFLSTALFPAQYVVRYVSGDVKLKNTSFKEGRKLNYMEAVKPGDTIVTGPSSFAALRSDDGSVIKITANTAFEISSLVKADDRREQTFNVSKGKIYASISKLSKKSDIQFRTPTAVAGVRGTQLILEISENGGTSLYVVEGKVAFGKDNSSLDILVSEGEMADSSKYEKKKMTARESEKAGSGIPVTIALITKEGVKSGEEAEKKLRETLKEELKGSIDEQKSRISESKDLIQEKAQWDIESGRVAGDYKIREVFKREGNNTMRIVNFTKNTKTGSMSFLDTTVYYSKGVPSLQEILAGDKIGDNAKQALTPSLVLTTLGAANKAGDKDLIQMTASQDKGMDFTLNGEKVIEYTKTRGGMDKSTGEVAYYVVEMKTEENNNYQFVLKAQLIDLGSMTGINFQSKEALSSKGDLFSILSSLGLKTTLSSSALNTGTIEIIMTTDILRQLAIRALTGF